MIGWLIVLGVILIPLVIGIISRIDSEYNDWEGLVLVPLTVIWIPLLVLVASPPSVKINMAKFESQKVYMATHIPKTEYEDAALTQSKIEINSWLFEAQANQDLWGIFSFYPESIQDIEPIQ